MWLSSLPTKPELLVEPFAGGGVVSLTAVMENLAGRCLMVELDRDVAAFWHAATRAGGDLAVRVSEFVPTASTVQQLAEHPPRTVLEHGFRTLVLNRTRRGGILTKGAGYMKAGENGRGLLSRWYPLTLAKAPNGHRAAFGSDRVRRRRRHGPDGSVNLPER